MTTGPWQRLGLDPTEDPVAIRRAYTRELKAIDPECDPQAFIELRNALEQATAEARYAAWDRAALEAETSPESAQPPQPSAAAIAPPLPGGLDSSGVSVSIGEAAPPNEEDAPYRRLSALLFAPDGEAPDPAALAAALDAILADPRLEGVAHAERVEQWLAAELFDSIPRSDPILAAAVGHFGWVADEARWDQPYMPARLVERHKALLLIDRLSSPSHSHHRAWLELTREGSSLAGRRLAGASDVNELLEAVRKRCPAAEEWFNPELVALWDQKQANKVAVPWGLVFFGFWLLILLMSRMGG